MFVNKVGVIVYDPLNKKILTISNQFGDNIGIPKGTWDDTDATCYDGALRELKEETGLSFGENKPPVHSEIYIRTHECLLFVIHLENGCDTADVCAPQTENIYHVQWMTCDEIIANISRCNYTLRKQTRRGKTNKINPKVQSLFQ